VTPDLALNYTPEERLGSLAKTNAEIEMRRVPLSDAIVSSLK